MNILALETSTEACSVALLREDGQIFSEYELAPRQHTRILPAMMDSVLKASGQTKKSLTYCAFANGPGAFTGIRIAAATAQGISLGLDIPLVQISTLATLAQASLDKYPVDSVVVALDARMGEVYWAKYERDNSGLAKLDGREQLNKLEDVMLDSSLECAAGHGWKLGADIWLAKFCINSNLPIDSELLPSAAAMVNLARQAVVEGRFTSAESISINYLRNRVADKPGTPSMI